MAKKAWAKMFMSILYIFKLSFCVPNKFETGKYAHFIFHYNSKVFFLSIIILGYDSNLQFLFWKSPFI